MTISWCDHNQKALELMEKGQVEEAVQSAEVALLMARRDYGDRDESVAIILNNLGEMYRLSGEFEKAEKNFRDSLACTEELKGKMSVACAETLGLLADLYRDLGKLSEAESEIMQAIEIYEGASEVADSNEICVQLYLRLAELQVGCEKFAEARQSYDRTLQLLDTLEGMNSPFAAMVFKSFALLERREGHESEAEKKLRKALGILERSSGPGSPDFASILVLLADGYLQQGGVQVAESLFMQAHSIYKDMLSPTDPERIGVQLRLAFVAMQMNQLSKAESFYKEAIKSYEDAGTKDPLLAEVQNGLAEMYIRSGKFEEAFALAQASLTIRERDLDNFHPAIAQSLNNLAVIYDRRGDHALAAKSHQRALEIRREAFGKDHPAVTQSLDNLAATYRMQGKFEQAATLITESVEIWSRHGGEAHPAVAQGCHNLALIKIDEKEYEEAEELLKRARRILEQNEQQHAFYLAQVFETMAGLYERMHRTAESSEYAARAMKIRHPDKMTRQENKKTVPLQ